MSDASLYTVTIRLPAGLSDVQASFFADEAFGGEQISSSLVREIPASEGDLKATAWTIQWLMAGIADTSALANQLNEAAMMFDLAGINLTPADLDCVTVNPDTNWLEQSYRSFPPFTVGQFYIHGSHSTDPAPDGFRALQIDAATAFGSGEHGTTAGCLLLLEQLKADGVQPHRILDMGCGSGILGIAAWMLFDRPVIASDIDAECIRVTDNHGHINHIPVWDEQPTTTGMATCAGDGFRLPLVQNHAPYTIVIANILPAPLLAMANDLVAAMEDNGFVILSGILNEQADEVENAYIALNLKPVTRMVRGDWTSLLMRKE
ncbi:50S ribosomal protein L11 methyltransferase [Micavibrio aeruginosavorus]|uniref:50S ribosomal protein L11 methyltransferase n=1 Tax=Micavibrio aeruginosavorus TaxID=349221 RepID=UPI003F4AC88A